MLKQLEMRLASFNQHHVLRFWAELDLEQQQQLARQLERVDLELMAKLFQKTRETTDWSGLAKRANSPPSVTLANQAEPKLRREAIAVGEQALRAGKVGAILVAGGQGSRLGFEHPKGMFPIGPLSKRTLFRMLIDLLKARAAHHQTRIPLFVMTSPATDQATRLHFADELNFDLPSEDLRVFCQGTMPAVDAATGQLLLASPSELFLSPDGHGGMLQAFHESGCLNEARVRGIEYLFYCQVDNPIVQLCDPLVIGLHLRNQADVTTQAIRKSHPLQKVGNIVSVGDRLEVIEYSDLPEELAHERLPDGSLRIWAGNIAVHVFSLSFLEQAARNVTSTGSGLPFHVAKKKVPFVDEHGRLVQPATENAFKFERFIFDLLPMAKRAMVVEVDAAEGFAAVKNPDSSPTESPTTTQAAIMAQQIRWLKSAGVEVANGVRVEIHPSVAHDAETVRQHFTGSGPITKDSYFVRN
ncbi:MAG: UTP--glucose-1-phosphate uridylyltransferase [Planctomycetaceae bacterium]|nr:UTP--glucose-1-phosphate uridylyltransferase [Planctomycetaceae bacterium]